MRSGGGDAGDYDRAVLAIGHFYLGMNYHAKGAPIARLLIPKLEAATGDRCTARWPYSPSHRLQGIRASIALTDVQDVARSDYVILAPLTMTARGCHVEMGLAFGLDKPCYLYRPDGVEGTAFDALCLPMPGGWRVLIEEAIREGIRGKGNDSDPASDGPTAGDRYAQDQGGRYGP